MCILKNIYVVKSSTTTPGIRRCSFETAKPFNNNPYCTVHNQFFEKAFIELFASLTKSSIHICMS